jgi:glucosamine-6-phosphate deaminase
MELIVTRDYEEMSAVGAEVVASIVTHNPRAVLGLTTGNTPVGLYQHLVTRHQRGQLSLHHIRAFCTEEYLGVSPQDDFGLFSWLNRLLIAPCNLSPSQVFRLRAEASEPQLACQEFEQQIEQLGGFDLVIQSVGTNGHIGFNEHGSPFDSRTRILALTEDTLEYNAHYWDMEVPRYALAIGLGTILAARRVLLLVSGRSKAEPMMKALCGPVTPDVPASVLQEVSHLTVIADQEAACLLIESEQERAG